MSAITNISPQKNNHRFGSLHLYTADWKKNTPLKRVDTRLWGDAEYSSGARSQYATEVHRISLKTGEDHLETLYKASMYSQGVTDVRTTTTRVPLLESQLNASMELSEPVPSTKYSEEFVIHFYVSGPGGLEFLALSGEQVVERHRLEPGWEKPDGLALSPVKYPTWAQTYNYKRIEGIHSGSHRHGKTANYTISQIPALYNYAQTFGTKDHILIAGVGEGFDAWLAYQLGFRSMTLVEISPSMAPHTYSFLDSNGVPRDFYNLLIQDAASLTQQQLEQVGVVMFNLGGKTYFGSGDRFLETILRDSSAHTIIAGGFDAGKIDLRKSIPGDPATKQLHLINQHMSPTGLELYLHDLAPWERGWPEDISTRSCAVPYSYVATIL